jgi:copper transport protein
VGGALSGAGRRRAAGARPARAVAIAAAVLAICLAARALRARAAREDLPPAFAGLTNPLAGDPASAAAGGALFREHCASCHGAAADGHGFAAAGLDPPPADLRTSGVLDRASDGSLFSRLGAGKPGTAMPAFGGTLDERARWALVAYLRSLRAGERPPAEDAGARGPLGGAGRTAGGP